MAIKNWSTTAASNVNALTGVGLGFDENQAPRLVNDAAREMMAQVAAFCADAYQGKCPYYAAGGTANAITVTANPALGSYAAGAGFVILAGSTNTGATTINVNGLGTKALQFQGNALKGGEVIANRLFMAYYDGTQFQLMTGFVHMVQDTTNKHLGIGSGVMANGTGGTSAANTGVGHGVLAALTTGVGNVAMGAEAGKLLTSGASSIAIGNGALDANQTGTANTAVGNDALGASTGSTNTAIGASALSAATSAGQNTAVGGSSGSSVTGDANTLVGWGAGVALGTGVNLTSGSQNTIVGGRATGAASGTSSAVMVGYEASAGTSGIAIGRGAVAGANKLALGSASYALDTQTTVGAAGAASALPANPTGYLEVVINGTARVIPFYAKS